MRRPSTTDFTVCTKINEVRSHVLGTKMISFKAYISPTISEWKSQKQITMTTARLNKKGKSVLDLKFCLMVHSNDLIKIFIGQKKITRLL